jgi:predicted transposase YdaD
MEECEMLAMKHPELEDSVDCVRKMSLFEQWRDVLFHLGLQRADRINRERYVRAEGKAEGRAEGKAEGKAEGQQEKALEIARKMKALGDSPEKIQAITGISPEEIAKHFGNFRTTSKD